MYNVRHRLEFAKLYTLGWWLADEHTVSRGVASVDVVHFDSRTH